MEYLESSMATHIREVAEALGMKITVIEQDW
jgi:hypothetical protein